MSQAAQTKTLLRIGIGCLLLAPLLVIAAILLLPVSIGVLGAIALIFITEILIGILLGIAQFFMFVWYGARVEPKKQSDNDYSLEQGKDV